MLSPVSVWHVVHLSQTDFKSSMVNTSSVFLFVCPAIMCECDLTCQCLPFPLPMKRVTCICLYSLRCLGRCQSGDMVSV